MRVFVSIEDDLGNSLANTLYPLRVTRTIRGTVLASLPEDVKENIERMAKEILTKEIYENNQNE